MKRLRMMISFLLIAAQSHASGPGQTSADFLLAYSDARPAALGNAYTALADDAGGIAFNPAGLVRTKHKQVTASYVHWIEESYFSHLSLTLPLGSQRDAFGASALFYNAGSFLYTNELGLTGRYKLQAYDIAGTMGYAREFGRFWSWGAAFKVIHRKLDIYKATTGGLDVGVLWQPLHTPFRTGLVIQNLGKRLTFISEKEKLPLTIRAGVTYPLWLDRVVLVGDAVRVIDDKRTDLALGIEATVIPGMKARAGWRSDRGLIHGWSLGGGAQFQSLTLDYAFVPFNVFGATHRLTGTLTFKGAGGPEVHTVPTAPFPSARPESRAPSTADALPREIRVLGADTAPVRVRVKKKQE